MVSGVVVITLAAAFVAFTGEDRALYGHSDRGRFWTERSAVAETFAGGGVPALLQRGAEVVCIDSVNVAAETQRRWRESLRSEHVIPAHRAPFNDSSISVFVGYADRTSQIFYLPKTPPFAAATKVALRKPEGSGCFHR